MIQLIYFLSLKIQENLLLIGWLGFFFIFYNSFFDFIAKAQKIFFELTDSLGKLLNQTHKSAGELKNHFRSASESVTHAGAQLSHQVDKTIGLVDNMNVLVLKADDIIKPAAALARSASEMTEVIPKMQNHHPSLRDSLLLIFSLHQPLWALSYFIVDWASQNYSHYNQMPTNIILKKTIDLIAIKPNKNLLEIAAQETLRITIAQGLSIILVLLLTPHKDLNHDPHVTFFHFAKNSFYLVCVATVFSQSKIYFSNQQPCEDNDLPSSQRSLLRNTRRG